MTKRSFALRRPFFRHHSFGSKPVAKSDNGIFQRTWHCCMCCNPANQGGGLLGWLALIKSSFITKDEFEASQLTRTIVQQQRKTLPILT
jgi:hypothetical protein